MGPTGQPTVAGMPMVLSSRHGVQGHRPAQRASGGWALPRSIPRLRRHNARSALRAHPEFLCQPAKHGRLFHGEGDRPAAHCRDLALTAINLIWNGSSADEGGLHDGILALPLTVQHWRRFPLPDLDWGHCPGLKSDQFRCKHRNFYRVEGQETSAKSLMSSADGMRFAEDWRAARANGIRHG